MAPSEEKMPPLHKPVLDQILVALKNANFKYVEGSKLVEYGDFVCSICKKIQGSAFGIAFSSAEFPISSLCNIFWEKGLMQGFGKPVILFVDDSPSLPSDFVRTFSIFYKISGWNKKFRNLLQNIKKLPGEFLFVTGDLALEAGDHEKAAKYYMDAFLIDESPEAIKKIEEVIGLLRDPESDEKGLRKRLLQNLQVFLKGVRRN